MLVELITVGSYWLTKEWIVNCCLSNLDEKSHSLYRKFLLIIYLLIFHLMIHRGFSENRDLCSSRRFSLLIKSSSSSVVTAIWSHQYRILISRRSRKSVDMKEIISAWINHLDWMIVERLDPDSTYWWRNWRYGSSQISRCDPWSGRSCMKNWMVM